MLVAFGMRVAPMTVSSSYESAGAWPSIGTKIWGETRLSTCTDKLLSTIATGLVTDQLLTRCHGRATPALPSGMWSPCTW